MTVESSGDAALGSVESCTEISVCQERDCLNIKTNWLAATLSLMFTIAYYHF